MNGHTQDMFFDGIGSRSPGAHRQQQHHHQTLNRHTSRQPMDAYGDIQGSSFLQEEQNPRYENNSRFDRGMNSSILPQDFYGMGAAQSWNPQAFASNGLGGAGPSFSSFGTIGGRMKPAQARRTNLPDTWLNDQPQMNPMGGFGGLGMNTSHLRSQNYLPEPDDDLIPTAIVIKNIPFAVKKEQLVEVMTELSLPLPYAFNYHFDNGVFRGLAFANFTSPDETATVIRVLNHYELQGRKLRVEYKKMLPLQERERIEREKRERRGQLEEQHRPVNGHTLNTQHSMSSLSSHMNAASPSPMSSGQGGFAPVDMNDATVLEYYNQILIFKSDLNRETLIFPAGLNTEERHIIHKLAHNLNMHHESRGEGENRQVHITRNTSSRISPPVPQISSFHADPSRRILNRAATTDFGEARANDAILYGTLRPQQSGGYLGVSDSPNIFANRGNELRSAKSFADLRYNTPSPVPSSASFPTALQTNAARVQDLAAAGNLPNTGAQGSSAAALHSAHNDHGFVNSFGNLNMGTGIGTGLNRGSPKSLRTMFSWDSHQSGPATAPIGSNRGFGMNSHSESTRDRNTNMPIRQPSIPSDRGTSAFSRNRQNGHQQRSSDEARHTGSEVIHE